jgi:hypothetical protein
VIVGIISVTQSGNTDNLDRFLKNMKANSLFDALETFGQEGVAALELTTPRETGSAAGSWYYIVTKTDIGATISWYNSDKDSAGTPIVIMLQYGHRTGTGGYVEGRDFINPATAKVFKDATDAVWKAVQS